MNLQQLALASFIYESAWPDDKNLFVGLRQALENDPKIAKRETGEKFVKWLNSWGCRIHKLSFHEIGISALREWRRKWQAKLAFGNSDLLNLTPAQLGWAAEAYEDLSHQKADKRRTFSVTASAKVLFAMWPKALPPWDDAIRKEYGCKDGSRDSYRRFLGCVIDELHDLERSCVAHGIKLRDVPERMGMEKVSLARMVDIYYYTIHTRQCKLLEPEKLQKRLELSVPCATHAESTNKPINQLTNRPVNQLTSQPINQSKQ